MSRKIISVLFCIVVVACSMYVTLRPESIWALLMSPEKTFAVLRLIVAVMICGLILVEKYLNQTARIGLALASVGVTAFAYTSFMSSTNTSSNILATLSIGDLVFLIEASCIVLLSCLESDKMPKLVRQPHYINRSALSATTRMKTYRLLSAK